jgi:hypothetical protein
MCSGVVLEYAGHGHSWDMWLVEVIDHCSYLRTALMKSIIYSIKGQMSVRQSVYARNSRTAAFKVSGRQLWSNGRLDAAEVLNFVISCE